MPPLLFLVAHNILLVPLTQRKGTQPRMPSAAAAAVEQPKSLLSAKRTHESLGPAPFSTRKLPILRAPKSVAALTELAHDYDAFGVWFRVVGQFPHSKDYGCS